MQNSLELNWLEIIKVAIPSLIALIVPLITYLWLARKMADYQTELSKDIENHKLQIQAEFQIRFYEFQTKFSLLHQQKAETIRELYSLITDIELFLPDAVNLTQFGKWEEIEARRQQIFNTCLNFHKCFSRNEIFFEEDIAESIKVFDDSVIGILSLFEKSQITRKEGVGKIFDDKTSTELWGDSYRKAKKELSPIKMLLKNQFRQLLFAEIQDYQLNKK